MGNKSLDILCRRNLIRGVRCFKTIGRIVQSRLKAAFPGRNSRATQGYYIFHNRDSKGYHRTVGFKKTALYL